MMSIEGEEIDDSWKWLNARLGDGELKIEAFDLSKQG